MRQIRHADPFNRPEWCGCFFMTVAAELPVDIDPAHNTGYTDIDRGVAKRMLDEQLLSTVSV